MPGMTAYFALLVTGNPNPLPIILSIKIFNDAASNNPCSTEYCQLLHRFDCLFLRSSPSTVLDEVDYASILV
jgi:hypothetical protein